MDKYLIERLQEKFEKDGFVIIRQFFSVEKVTEICRRAELVLENRIEYHGKFTNITKGLEKADEYFERLLHEGPQIEILEQL